MTKETKTIKELKKVNHKLKHQYDLLQIRHCALNSSYQRILVALNETIERNSKAIEYIYLHSTQRKWFADISDRLHNQEIQFKGRIEDLLDILKGVDKE